MNDLKKQHDMTKEHFKTLMESIDDKIEELEKERVKAEQEYIEANKQFSIGDRVKNDRGIEGEVVDIKISWGTEIRYKLHKIKQDGTVSQHSLHYGAIAKEITPV